MEIIEKSTRAIHSSEDVTNVNLNNYTKQNSWYFLKKNYYIVQPLDTLEKISKKLNIPLNLLKQKNIGKKLFIGQKINL